MWFSHVDATSSVTWTSALVKAACPNKLNQFQFFLYSTRARYMRLHPSWSAIKLIVEVPRSEQSPLNIDMRLSTLTRDDRSQHLTVYYGCLALGELRFIMAPKFGAPNMGLGNIYYSETRTRTLRSPLHPMDPSLSEFDIEFYQARLCKMISLWQREVEKEDYTASLWHMCFLLWTLYQRCDSVGHLVVQRCKALGGP